MCSNPVSVHSVITMMFQYRDSVLHAVELQNLTQSLVTGEHNAKNSGD